jgi:hypothetical protein
MSPANPVDELDASLNDFGHKPVKSSKSPLPEVKEFDSPLATVEDIVNALKIAGGVIVRNFLSLQEIDRILEDVNPYLDSDKPWDGKQNEHITNSSRNLTQSL